MRLGPRLRRVCHLARVFRRPLRPVDPPRFRRTLRGRHPVVGLGGIPPIGNAYNPAGYSHSVIQPFQKYPYEAAFGSYNDDGNSTKTPFQFYISAKIKL